MARERKLFRFKSQSGDEKKPLKKGILFAPATIDDMSGFFMIDTGAFMTLVNSARIDRKFWEVRPQAGHYIIDAKGNGERVDIINFRIFRLGDMDIDKKTEVAYVEMGKKDYINSKSGKIPIIGVIGVDILRSHNAIIDFGNRKLYLHK